MPTGYALLKLLHLVAVVLFLGNVTFGLFWVNHAERERDARLIAHAMRGVIRSDRWFTVPGVFLIIIGGTAAAGIGGLRLLHTPWITWSIAMFALSGAVFGMFIAPLQRRIAATAEGIDALQLAALLKRWHLWGWASVLPLWLAVAFMVMKVPN